MQINPLPEYPAKQSQVYDPLELVHSDVPSLVQLSVPRKHSSTSVQILGRKIKK